MTHLSCRLWPCVGRLVFLQTFLHSGGFKSKIGKAYQLSSIPLLDSTGGCVLTFFAASLFGRSEGPMLSDIFFERPQGGNKTIKRGLKLRDYF
jgi:hypothetical protein